MTIRKGQEWGTIAVPSSELVTAHTDAEVRSIVESARRSGQEIPTVGLLGGDLMRTVGGSADPTRFSGGQSVPHLPVDLVHVVVDDSREAWFVAHLVARRSWWHGAITAVMNAQFHRRWDVSPRGHPNDGKVDVVSVSAEMTLQQRWLARSRLALGTHVPHPLITITQRTSTTVELPLPTPLWVDGQRWGSGRHLQIDVEPDAFIVCV
ncbi:unannotated protein [freshwater metagenome]|uniref:Unannotated protein n=1 Tax=freshwater metagenome TaxID=449393 RepID=A0A6J7FFB8_9ZZZZ|nr:hypothetical protein [Actinomycetota bacterium]